MKPSSTLLPWCFGLVFSASFPALGSAAYGDDSGGGDIVELARYTVSGVHSDSNYKADRLTSGTRTDTALLDVPQAVTLVTQEQIRDQQMRSVADVVAYVPGVSAHQGENNRDQLIFRGQSSSADFFVNGVRDDVQYYRDLYNLERVEVLRGPNAMIFGRGGGGGVINRTLKEAGETRREEATVSVGSFDQRRIAVDLDQPLGRAAAVRLNAMTEAAHSFRDGVRLEREGINPTATFQPAEATKVTVGYEFLHDRRTADRGITSFAGRPVEVPIGTYYGNPTDSRVRADVHLVTVAIEHRRGAWTVRDHAMFGDYDRGYQNYVPGAVAAAQTAVSLSAYNNATWRRNAFNQLDVTREATTGAVQHTLLGGIEVGRQLTYNFRRTGYFGTSTTLLVPYSAPTITETATFRQSATDADNHVVNTTAAAYAQDQVTLTPQWQVVAGVRGERFALAYHNHRTGEEFTRTDTLVSPRLGVIYKPERTVALYGSVTVSYLPSAGDQFSSLTTLTQQMKPERFVNQELGAKWDLPRDWFLTTAVYQLDRTNTRATDPNDATRVLQTGAERSRGVELGLTGAVTHAWTMSAGYALQDAVIRSATTASRAGAKVPQVPRHNASWWNKWQATPAVGFGLGVVCRSAGYAAADNAVVLPGYARVDAAVYARLSEHWRAQVNVENVLDRRYAANADNNTNISPGAPRTVRVGATLEF